MSKYFTISSGLRGCYMPDSVFVARVDTRRELKRLLADEAATWRDAGAMGGSKVAVATIAAAAWREAKKARPAILPYCIPLKPSGAMSYSSGVFVSAATRRDYLDSQEAES
jgi:hypothetical protein